MTEIEWRDPAPPRRQTSPQTLEILRALKRNKGRWAVVKVCSYTSAAQRFRTLGCDTATRRRDDGRIDIFARWPAEP